jgi:nucleoside-diphosphate-sugar epimerase
MTKRYVGVLGATSLVGEYVLPLLRQQDWQVRAFSRQAQASIDENIIWQQFNSASQESEPITHWLSVAPIWIVPQYFSLFERHGVRQLVVLSSTSRFTKDNSSDFAEQEIAHRLADAEQQVRAWASQHHVNCVILRPTLIYGSGRDKNIAEIARFIRQFGFFPVLGRASGLRQPIHVEDVAQVCVSALTTENIQTSAYNISGAEVLTYRDMVTRIFVVLDRQPRVLTVPLFLFRLAISCLRILPRYRQWSPAMAERMSRDLVFDHQLAIKELAFKPRSFVITQKDVGL